MKLKNEIEERRAEFEAVSHASDTQVDTLEKKLDETKKKYTDELHYKEQRIQSLEEQLGYPLHHLHRYQCLLSTEKKTNSVIIWKTTAVRSIIALN